MTNQNFHQKKYDHLTKTKPSNTKNLSGFLRSPGCHLMQFLLADHSKQFSSLISSSEKFFAPFSIDWD